MNQKKNKGLDFKIDLLTNSIKNVVSGDSSPTDITLGLISNQLQRKPDGYSAGNMNLNNLSVMYTNCQ